MPNWDILMKETQPGLCLKRMPNRDVLMKETQPEFNDENTQSVLNAKS